MGGGGSSADASPPPVNTGTGYPPPREDLVPSIGSPTAIDIATWNVRNFPTDGRTPALLADLITSLGLDFVAVEEIDDVDAFNQLVTRLPHHDGLLSSHVYGDGSYQKVGFIYRSDLMTVDGGALLFENQGYDFPRPPLQVQVTVNDGQHPVVRFTAIVVHLKAGVSDSDRNRRTAAILALEDHVRAVVNSGQQDQVLILGDFNQEITSSQGQQVFAPFLGAPNRYAVRTEPVALAGGYSFLPYHDEIDHIVTTAGLDGEMSAADPIIPRLDQEMAGYQQAVSDHLPVAAAMPVLQ